MYSPYCRVHFLKKSVDFIVVVYEKLSWALIRNDCTTIINVLFKSQQCHLKKNLLILSFGNYHLDQYQMQCALCRTIHTTSLNNRLVAATCLSTVVCVGVLPNIPMLYM